MIVEPILIQTENLQERCQYWMKKLNLRDWDGVIVESNGDDMNNAEADAETHVDWPMKLFYIRILGPEYNRHPLFIRDMEHELVHELLHIYLTPFETEKNGDLIEQTVNMLARSIIAIERNKSEYDNLKAEVNNRVKLEGILRGEMEALESALEDKRREIEFLQSSLEKINRIMNPTPKGLENVAEQYAHKIILEKWDKLNGDTK